MTAANDRHTARLPIQSAGELPAEYEWNAYQMRALPGRYMCEAHQITPW